VIGKKQSTEKEEKQRLINKHVFSFSTPGLLFHINYTFEKYSKGLKKYEHIFSFF